MKKLHDGPAGCGQAHYDLVTVDKPIMTLTPNRIQEVNILSFYPRSQQSKSKNKIWTRGGTKRLKKER